MNQESSDSVVWHVEHVQDLQAALGIASSDASAHFAGILARSSDTLGLLGYSMDTEQILSLTRPIFLQAPDEDGEQRATVVMLNEALDVARRNQLASLRMLLPHESSGGPDYRPALQQAGYQNRATVSDWTCPLNHSLRITSASLCLSEIPGAGTEGEKWVLAFLHDATEDSEDLRMLPPPSPEMMLRDWRQQAAVWACTTDTNGRLQALIVLTTEERQLRILYVATSPRCRRHGQARTLIESVCGSPFAETLTAVAATADEANASARRLYESLGFQKQPGFEIWCLDTEPSLLSSH